MSPFYKGRGIRVIRSAGKQEALGVLGVPKILEVVGLLEITGKAQDILALAVYCVFGQLSVGV